MRWSTELGGKSISGSDAVYRHLEAEEIARHGWPTNSNQARQRVRIMLRGLLAAFRELSLSARRVLDRLEIEFADHGGTNNGKLPVTYDDFKVYGIHRHSVAPAIREAVALGFVEVTEPGRAGNAEHRKPNLFRLTYRHTDNGPPTHEWERIETEEQAVATAKSARAAKKNKNQ